jgi:serine phosphatase RsbU (regulator of sigma subunit)
MAKGIFNTGFPKVTLAFVGIILIVIINLVFSIYITQKNKSRLNEISDVVTPFTESLEKFDHVVTENKMYATNWVFLEFSQDDKDSLVALQTKRYPFVKKELSSYLTKINLPAEADSVNDVFKQFEELIKIEKEAIMDVLIKTEDYNNTLVKLECEDVVQMEVLPRSHKILTKLSGINARNRIYADKTRNELQSAASRSMTIMLIASVVLCLIIVFTMSFISRAIREPVLKMKRIIHRLGKGEIPEEKVVAGKDVIGEMAASVNALSDSYKQTALFANEIGKNHFTVQYEKLSDNDILGNALIQMRDSLRSYSEDMETQVKDRTREVLEKGYKLELAYNEIKDSIHYAKKIQESLLPSNAIMTSSFPDSFIYYRPKDIVCGDFYWFNQIGDEFVMALIDCTGHGVPGALMTMIGSLLLTQVVNFGGSTDPSRILSGLDKRLLETLKQHGSVVTNDGMDAAVIRYKISKGELTFSGAKRPLLMFKGSELLEIKGDKSPIGSFGHDFDKRFTDQKFKMNKGDTVYIFSDGVPDQFGGSEGKKFMIKKFRELLLKVNTLPMHQVAKDIDREISSWQGEFDQTDDMLLVGIRF